MEYTEKLIEDFIAENAEEKYREFHSKLTRTSYPINGIRVPLLRKFAKTIAACENVQDFFDSKVSCYEHVMLKGLALGFAGKDEAFFSRLENFLLEIDDWAVCDVACGNVKRKDSRYIDKCLEYAASAHIWTARWGIVAMMSFCDRDEDIRRVVKSVRAKDYYIDMAIAWLIQVLAVKNRPLAQEFLAGERVSDTVKKLAVRKIRDSFRISAEDKEYFTALIK